jgi:hypothetical protein
MTGCNLAESFKEGYSSRMTVLPMMMVVVVVVVVVVVMMTHVLCFHLKHMNIRKRKEQAEIIAQKCHRAVYWGYSKCRPLVPKHRNCRCINHGHSLCTRIMYLRS